MTTHRRRKRDRLLILGLAVSMIAVSGGLGGATVAASAGGERVVGRPRTLLVSSHRIWAFALGAKRITWISHAHMPGRVTDCGMYVQTLRSKRISVAPLPRAGCGVTPPRNFAAQEPVLASGAAAWVTGHSCGNVECFWKIATISAGERHWWIADEADVSCAFSCDASFLPQPALAGAGNLLVYSAGLGRNPDSNIDRLRRIVGRHTVRFAVTPGAGDIEQLVVGGGAVEAISRVLDAGDGCGCLDSPAWSPDGSKIAYFHGTFPALEVDPGMPPQAALAVMNADGSGRHDLTAPTAVTGAPTWSPDGKQVAYATYSKTIVVAHADGSAWLQLGPGYDPAWSPDGSKIAFASAGCNDTTAAISVMDADGTNAHQIANLPTCVDPGGMAWSPDGTRIAFSLNRTLEVMNADGSNPHPLGSGTLGDEPSWSPDSSQIVFHTPTGLSVIGADGSGLHQLTKFTNGLDEHPSWSPDGQTIVFGSERNDPYVNAHELYYHAFPELYLVDRDGSHLRPLSFTKPAAFKDQATFYSASGKRLPSLPGVPTLAGHIAAVGSAVGGVRRIALFDARTGRPLAVVRVGASRGKFSVAGANNHWIIFHIGRTISALDVRSHKVVRLAKAAADPLDPSVSGRRIAWAENIRGHGRIRSLLLPS